VVIFIRMGKTYIISEQQRNMLLEQESKLNYLVGKKINLYYDSSNSRYTTQVKVKSTDGRTIKIEPEVFEGEKTGQWWYITQMYPECNYSTGLVDRLEVRGWESDLSFEEKNRFPFTISQPTKTKLYNKKLLDEINLKKLISCSRPKADYSSTRQQTNNKIS
jgi:hypothetical protein